MTTFTIAVLVGSLRKDSINLKLAKALSLLMQEKCSSTILKIDNLPLFNQDLEADFPAEATRLKEAIANADGLLVVTPEYNRSIPAPLKNALDWASRPYGKNSLAGKPTALCGTSPGAIGTACAQQALRPVLCYLDTLLMNSPEMYLQFKEDMIQPDGTITNESTRKFLQGFTDQYISWLARHSGKH